MKRFKDYTLLISLPLAFYGPGAIKAVAQGTTAAAPEIVPQVSANAPLGGTVNLNSFNLPGNVERFAGLEIADNPRAFAAPVLSREVGNFASKIADSYGLIRTLDGLHDDLTSEAARESPNSLEFGPKRLIARSIAMGLVPTLQSVPGIDGRTGIQLHEMALTFQVAASKNRILMRRLEKLGDAVLALDLRAKTQAEKRTAAGDLAYPTLAALNNFWDQPGELRDALNHRRISEALSQPSVRADAPREIRQLPSARLQPAPWTDAKAVWAPELASALQEIAPQIKVKNVGRMLSQLKAQAEKNADFEDAMDRIRGRHPAWQPLINPQQTFLLNTASRQEPNLLELLGIGSENTATGYVRILIDGQDMMPVLIVARPPHRRMSTKEFERILGQTAAPYFAIQHMMAARQNGSRLARAAAKPPFHLFHNVDDPSITHAPSRIDRLPWSAASVSWQLDLARKAAKRAWAKKTSQLFPRFDFPGAHTADAADLAAQILLLPIMRELAASERPNAPAAAYVH